MLERVGARVRVPPVVAGVAAAPFVLWAVARIIGLDGFSPAAELIAFTPYVAAASVIAVAVALFARQWWTVGAAAVACLVLAGCVLPRTFGTASTMDGVPLTVMSVNMFEGGADTEAIVATVRGNRVDVLAVQEFTPTAEAGLAAAGLTGILPYHENKPITDTPGSGLYSRYPLTGTGSVLNEGGFYQAHGIVQVPGAGGVLVVSVHSMAPAESDFIPLWKKDLRNEPRASSSGPPQILAGDFNATVDHSELRRLIATGYHDAASTVGDGLTPTWPFYGPRSTVTPKVTIDHVLVDERIGVRDFSAHTIPRSDHRAVVTQLILPRA